MLQVQCFLLLKNAAISGSFHWFILDTEQFEMPPWCLVLLVESKNKDSTRTQSHNICFCRISFSWTEKTLCQQEWEKTMFCCRCKYFSLLLTWRLLLHGKIQGEPIGFTRFNLHVPCTTLDDCYVIRKSKFALYSPHSYFIYYL